MRKAIVIPITLLTLLLCVSSSTVGGIMEKVIAEKRLRVGIVPWVGFIQRDVKTKRSEGIVADDLRNSEKITGIRLENIETSWREMIPGLRAGKWDAIMNGLGASIKRSLEVSFTEPYGYYCEAALIRIDDDTVKCFADMDQPGSVITCVAGTSAQGLWEGKFRKAKLYPATRRGCGYTGSHSGKGQGLHERLVS
jgi:polar amino acid transport system substrate-binding protein